MQVRKKESIMKLLIINFTLSLFLLSFDAHSQSRRGQQQQEARRQEQRARAQQEARRQGQRTQQRHNHQAFESFSARNLYKNIYGQEVIAVKRLLQNHLGVKLNQSAIKKVIVKLDAHSYRSKISLMIDGYEVETRRQLAMGSQVVFTISHYDQRKQIKLKVQGDITLHSVSVQVERQSNRQLVARNLRLGNDYSGSERRMLDQVFSQTHLGYSKIISSLQIDASAYSRKASIMVVLKGYGSLQTIQLGKYSNLQTVIIPGGADIRDISLVTRGSVMVNQISAR